MRKKARQQQPRQKPAKPPPGATGGTVPPAPGEKLTPEEQMERFAQELKNEDWGHQPC